jgi:hypothetical protein
MRLGTSIAQALIGGASGAGCMTTVRMATRQFGWIDATPPQATRDWLARRIGMSPDGPGTSQIVDSLVHLAVSVGGGAVYGALVRNTRQPSVLGGAAFGLGVWALAFGLVAPGLGITRSPRRGTWQETVVNVAAHLVYGAAMALVTRELRGQTHGLDMPLRAVRARVG